MFIQVEKVVTCERFASREAEFQGPGLGQLIHDAKDFSGAELLADRIGTIEAICVAHHTVQIAPAGDLPLARVGEALGKMREFILCNHESSGHFLDRVDGEEVIKQQGEVLRQLVCLNLILAAEVGDDILRRPLTVDSIPERCSGFVQDIDAIGFGERPFDGDQNAFASHVSLHVVGIFGIDRSGGHRCRQDSKSLKALLVLFKALCRWGCNDHVLSSPIDLSDDDATFYQFLAQFLFALKDM
jgi:hypothetical protein